MLTCNYRYLTVNLDCCGRIINASPNHKLILGYEPSELIGTNIFKNIHIVDKILIMDRLIIALRRLSCAGYLSFRFRHKDGSWHKMRSVGTPYKKKSEIYGRDIGFMLWSRDLTYEAQIKQQSLI